MHSGGFFCGFASQNGCAARCLAGDAWRYDDDGFTVSFKNSLPVSHPLELDFFKIFDWKEERFRKICCRNVI